MGKPSSFKLQDLLFAGPTEIQVEVAQRGGGKKKVVISIKVKKKKDGYYYREKQQYSLG